MVTRFHGDEKLSCHYKGKKILTELFFWKRDFFWLLNVSLLQSHSLVSHTFLNTICNVILVPHTPPSSWKLCFSRPYHAMLLLVDSRELIKSLPIDSSPALIRLLKICSPKKNLQELAADSDLELSQVSM